MKTYGDLITEVGTYLGRPDTIYQQHIIDAINRAQEDYVRTVNTPATRRQRTVYYPGYRPFGLPMDVDTVLWVAQEDPAAPVAPGGEWYATDPDLMFGAAARSHAYEWRPEGYRPIQRPVNGTIYVASDYESDSRTVYVSGEREQDVIDSTYVNISGTEAATLSVDFTQVHAIAVNTASADGIITLSDASGPLAVIPKHAQAPRYTWISLLSDVAYSAPLRIGYIPRVWPVSNIEQPLPPIIPYDYLFWSAVRQCAVDLDRAEEAALAGQEMARIVSREPLKQIGYGDYAARIYPVTRGLDGDGVA